MMWCRSCVSCVARASSSHTERRAGPVVRRRRTVSGRLPPTAASGTCAPPPNWTAILPHADTGLLLLVMRVVVHPECSFYLQLHEAAEFTDENSKRCPKTVELLRSAIPK